MATTTLRNIILLEENQARAHVIVNELMKAVDGFFGSVTIKNALTTPPGGPVNGEVYWIKATATGDWIGKEDHYALYADGWVFIPRKVGDVVWFTHLNKLAVVFNTGAAREISYSGTDLTL